jgi:hypothetical protein
MVSIGIWIVENWQLLIAVGVLFILLGLSGNLTRAARDAKKGLTEAMTPLGFIILLALAYIVYQMYLSIMVTL